MAIRLTARTLDHLRARHPEIAPYVDRIAPTVEHPDVLLEGMRGEYKAIKEHRDLPVRAKHVVVVYRQLGADKVVITGYLTSDRTRIRGELVWRRPL